MNIANCVRASAAISKSSLSILYILFSTVAAAVINNLALKKRETINSNFIRYKSLNPAPTYAQSSCRPAPLILHKLRCCYYIFFFWKKIRETCYNAWRGLRMTPLFGCFCPGNDQKKCERIYSFIYNNTCVGKFEFIFLHTASWFCCCSCCVIFYLSISIRLIDCHHTIIIIT